MHSGPSYLLLVIQRRRNANVFTTGQTYHYGCMNWLRNFTVLYLLFMLDSKLCCRPGIVYIY